MAGNVTIENLVVNNKPGIIRLANPSMTMKNQLCGALRIMDPSMVVLGTESGTINHCNLEPYVSRYLLAQISLYLTYCRSKIPTSATNKHRLSDGRSLGGSSKPGIYGQAVLWLLSNEILEIYRAPVWLVDSYLPSIHLLLNVLLLILSIVSHLPSVHLIIIKY